MTVPTLDPPRRAYLLPNGLTGLALAAGFFAIVAAIDGNFGRAGIAIYVAMVFDALDGRVARLTGTESAFGREFDSLTDMIAFGLAPAVVVYQWGVEQLTDYHLAWGRLGWLVTFAYVMCAAVRLARFNTNATDAAPSRFFRGLPSPSAAAVVAAFVWLSAREEVAGLGGLLLALVVTAVVGMLMVSAIPYRSFKELPLAGGLLVAAAVLAALALSTVDMASALLALFGSYVLSGPVMALVRRAGQRGSRDASDGDG